MSEIQDLPRDDYELISFEAGDYQDNFGNFWCSAAFKGVSEPVRWVVKDPARVAVGEKYYGRFTLETSKANKPYIRFRKEQRPDQPQSQLPVQEALHKSTYTPRDDNAIRAQWAIGQAVGVHKDHINEVKALAKTLYEMVDEIKDSSPKVNAPSEGLTPEEEVAQAQAKRDGERLRNTFNDGSPVPVFDEVFPVEDEIDLSSIPF